MTVHSFALPSHSPLANMLMHMQSNAHERFLFAPSAKYNEFLRFKSTHMRSNTIELCSDSRFRGFGIQCTAILQEIHHVLLGMFAIDEVAHVPAHVRAVRKIVLARVL